jgi:hypothetical protein
LTPPGIVISSEICPSCSPVVHWCFRETYRFHIKGQRIIQASREEEYPMPMYSLNVHYVTYVYIKLNLNFSAVFFSFPYVKPFTHMDKRALCCGWNCSVEFTEC